MTKHQKLDVDTDSEIEITAPNLEAFSKCRVYEGYEWLGRGGKSPFTTIMQSRRAELFRSQGRQQSPATRINVHLKGINGPLYIMGHYRPTGRHNQSKPTLDELEKIFKVAVFQLQSIVQRYPDSRPSTEARKILKVLRVQATPIELKQ